MNGKNKDMTSGEQRTEKAIDLRMRPDPYDFTVATPFKHGTFQEFLLITSDKEKLISKLPLQT